MKQVTQDIPVEDMTSSQIYKHYLKHQEKKQIEKVVKPIMKKAKQLVVQQRKNKQKFINSH